MLVRFAKNAADLIEPDIDGLRIMATRFWPRGIKKGVADLCLPDLAPSKNLVQLFKAGAMPWAAFAKAYKAEMKGQTFLIRTLKHLSERGEVVTVLCACDAPDTCHRSLLANLIDHA
jgi:uncharacterized protein YeaO (DUF488 family)